MGITERNPRLVSTEQSRVTAREVSEFVSESLALSRRGLSTSRETRLAYQQRKAELLSRIAARLDTAQAHATAADAWRRLAELRAQASGETQAGGDV